jgi:hypothetical protein
MSDPRYTDPPNDPRRPAARRPLEDDSGRGTMWALIVGIVAFIVVAMMVYGYKPISTASSPPATNSLTTTGAAPAPAPGINPPVAAPTPTPATPAPASPAPGDAPR